MRPRKPPTIDSYEFGKLVLGGETHTNDLILLPDRVFANWWRDEGHSLSPADLELVFHTQPDLLIVGTGAQGRMDVPALTRSAVEKRGIELVVQRTPDAVETYNRLHDERRLAAALHLTC
ncbi:MAG: Mth938-like domain-containing protein [Planctomycetota bacterium]